MNNLTSMFLGIVQGLTEFWPISSSGHLVFFQNLFGYKEPELLLDISLHMGTLLAVCIYFRSDLARMFRETLNYIKDIFKGKATIRSINERPSVMETLWIIVGTIPTAIIGFIFKTPLEKLFGNLNSVGFMLICTGIIVASTKLISKSYCNRDSVGLLTAVAIGIAQGVAIIPGISRSGATIVCGMLFKMNREFSVRFSFLLSIPAILGAMVLQLVSGGSNNINIMPMIFGFISSAVVGLIALRFLVSMVRKDHLAYFAPYCWALGLAIILF